MIASKIIKIFNTRYTCTSYEIRSDGRIFLKKGKTGKWKETGLCNDNGKSYYWLRFNGKKKYVHRLIMEVFYDCEIPKHLTIDHIDRNIYNNSLENLRFATHSEQLENRKNTKFTENEIKSLGSQSNNYRIELAKRNGFKTYADYLYYRRHGVKR
jgi:hypothetical protein